MKKLIFILSIVLAVSCKKEHKETPKVIAETVDNYNYKDVYGSWVGQFIADSTQGNLEDFAYSNKINVVIKKIENNKVYGKSIVSGNDRPFYGTVKKNGEVLEFEVAEPGDDSYDGKFYFQIKNNKLTGFWFANDKKASVISRKYDLEKQEFKYDPNLMLDEDSEYVDWYSQKLDSTVEVIDGEKEVYFNETYRSASDVILKINASTTKLTEDDLKNLKKLELEIIRNTIFARHGYSFKKKGYRQFFDYVDWYVPVTNNVDNALTSLEKENIILLKKFEKYAEDNYDTFGR
jgi:hypothetical protein